MIEFKGEKLVFLSNTTKNGEAELLDKNDLSNATFLLAGDFGSSSANSEDLLKAVKGDDLHIAVNGTTGESWMRQTLPEEICYDLPDYTKKIYFTVSKLKGKYKEVCGDIVFIIALKNDTVTVKEMMKNGKKYEKLTETEYYKEL